MQKFTIKQFKAAFPNDDVCLEYIRVKKYPKRIDCEQCGKNALFHKVSGRKVYACDSCGYQISPTAGTIYHKSSTPLTLWFYAIYLMAQTRTGISAKQLERELGVTYKTAWRMFKMIRSRLGESGDMFGGNNNDVEVDETYVGGPRRGKRGRGAAGKTPVVGGVESGDGGRAKVMPNTQ